MSVPFTIDIWSDVVCPFCYLGQRQLAGALEQFEHRDDVVIAHHAFELDPRAKFSYDRPLAELVARKYDMPVERAESLHHQLETEAAALGMTWSLSSAQPTNTFDAPVEVQTREFSLPTQSSSWVCSFEPHSVTCLVVEIK